MQRLKVEEINCGKGRDIEMILRSQVEVVYRRAKPL